MRTCIGCDDELPEYSGRGRPAIWCSERCRKEHPDAALAVWQFGSGRVVSLTVSMTPEMYERVKFCAHRANLSMSTWAAELIGDTLALEDAEEDVA